MSPATTTSTSTQTAEAVPDRAWLQRAYTECGPGGYCNLVAYFLGQVVACDAGWTYTGKLVTRAEAIAVTYLQRRAVIFPDR